MTTRCGAKVFPVVCVGGSATLPAIPQSNTLCAARTPRARRAVPAHQNLARPSDSSDATSSNNGDGSGSSGGHYLFKSADRGAFGLLCCVDFFKGQF